MKNEGYGVACYRTRRGAGRAAQNPSPLDAIRPSEWHPDWNLELLEFLTVLTRTIDLYPRGIALLDRILYGPLIAAVDLPAPLDHLRKPPSVDRFSNQIEMQGGVT